MRLTSSEPAHVHYGRRVYHIGPLVLAGAGAQIEVSGDMATSGALSLHARGLGDLRALNGMSAKVEWLGGRFDLDARVQGRLEAPLLDGGFKVADGALRLTSTAQVVSDVQARVGLTGRAITIESGSAAVGGGTANVSGQVLLAAGARPEIDVRADLKSVSIRPYADLQMTVGGGLNLTGSTGDLELKGNLKVDSLRYTAALDLPRLIPQRRAPPLVVPTFEPGQSIHLNVRVQAPGNLVVSGNVIDAEFRADLMATGTTERLGLLGSLTPLRAKARYRDNMFTVERASIDFTEEFRIFTQFDIRATTQACGMRVAVEVHGDSDRYKVTPSGQDEDGPVEQQDVLACLQFGLRLAELERLRESTGAKTEDRPPGEGLLQDPVVQSGLGALLVVTGVDAQVRKIVPVDDVRLTSGW
ncbi:MAG: translocation/assembly module TamB domain-containing protein, partial [Deltaproteobacteria bacterium]|nr:translocation/assembly module TamB domain-containing protein [Deltaproteobacteria bacterium]